MKLKKILVMTIISIICIISSFISCNKSLAISDKEIDENTPEELEYVCETNSAEDFVECEENEVTENQKEEQNTYNEDCTQEIDNKCENVEEKDSQYYDNTNNETISENETTSISQKKEYGSSETNSQITGIVYDQNTGKRYKYINGVIDTKYNGLYDYDGYKWYIKNGVASNIESYYDAKTKCRYKITNGKVDLSFTGLVDGTSAGKAVKVYLENGKTNTTYTGTYTQNGTTWYIKNGTSVTTTGIVSDTKTKKQYKIIEGKVDSKYNGLYDYSGSKWCIQNGEVANVESYYDAKTKCRYKITDGKVDLSYTGLVDGTNAGKVVKIYLEKGKTNTKFNGLYTQDGITWYIQNGISSNVESYYDAKTKCRYKITNGKVDLSFTGLVDGTSAGKAVKVYLENGKTNTTYTGTYTQSGTTWYIKNGTSVTTTGIVSDTKTGKQYKVTVGKVDIKYNGLYDYSGSKWCIQNGEVAKVESYYDSRTKCRYKITNGKVDLSFTGLVDGTSGGKKVKVYLENGKTNTAYTGTYTQSGTTWYIKKGTSVLTTGIITDSVTGKQYKVTEGKVDDTFNGLYAYNNNVYFLQNGNLTKNQLVTVNSKKYYFNDQGIMQTGDVTLDDQTYYFNELGCMELRDNYSYMEEDYCYNIEKGKARIVWYDGTAPNIIVPSSIGDYPVIRIGNNAFFKSRNIIQNVVLEDGITIIEENAFYACDKLKSITFPDSITRIGENAFGKCSSLEEVNMSDKAAVNIRDGAFEDCTSLKQIELSNRATVLSSVFTRCTSLETVKLPAVYGEIPYKFFSGCTNLKNIEIPIYVKKIGDYAFENCTGLTALTIPKEVTTIGENAFSGCTDITLYVEKDSPAHIFALNNNINYVVMGEEVSNEPYRYYYYQLDDRAKILYDEIVDHLDAIKSGVDSIILSNKVNEYAQAHGIDSFFDGVMQDTVDAFNLDYTDVFYWDCTKTGLSRSGYTHYFKAYNGASNFLEDEFNSAAKVEIACNKVDTKINQIMSGISSDSTDYEIVATVHDWLVDNLDYDYTFSTNCHNVYGTLVESKPVCEGYARTFKTLMDKYDIACIIVTGTGINSSGSEAHSWNYVQLDGEWYAMDVTWDDPKINGTGTPDEEWLNQVHHSYFLKGANDTNFMNSHILDNDFEVPTLNGGDYVGAA